MVLRLEQTPKQPKPGISLSKEATNTVKKRARKRNREVRRINIENGIGVVKEEKIVRENKRQNNKQKV